MNKEFKFDPQAVKDLAQILQETQLTEIEYEDQGVRIRVSRNVQHVNIPVSMPVMEHAPIHSDPVSNTSVSSGENVTSPLVGTAYLKPSPNADNFVKVGDRVSTGQTLMIIEAMKLMNPLKSPRDGVVKSILVADAMPVEYGQALVVLE